MNQNLKTTDRTRLIGMLIWLPSTLIFTWKIYTFLRSTDTPSDFLFQKLLVESVILFLVMSISFWTYLKGRVVVFGVILLGSTLFLMTFFLELVLKTGWFDCIECNSPVWIPPQYKQQDQEINRQNMQVALKNRYGFTDENFNVQRSSSVKKRIAILGDSFVWGDGLPHGQGWAHQIKKMITTAHPDVEVMIWGRQGWSTLVEWDFLKKEGLKYKPDFLVVGFVDNDPDLMDIAQKNLTWQNSSYFTPVRWFAPNAFDFLVSHVNSVLTRYWLKEYSYLAWLQKLYSPENLAQYGDLLKEFSDTCRKNNLPLLFVFTPNYPTPFFREEYDKIIPLMQKTQIPYLDLYPNFYSTFKDIPLRKMYANPANGHPNAEASTFYAQSVFDWMKEKGVLP